MVNARALIAPWRLHELRRPVATGCALLGVQLPVIERALSAASGNFGGIIGVYQRHTFLAERPIAMEAWAWHVESLLADRADNYGVFKVP